MYILEMIVRIPTHEPHGEATDVPEPAVQVVERVADEKGEDPVALGRLNDVVDPDALNELVGHEPAAVEIEFEYENRRVIVRGDGRVRVK